MKGIHSKPSNEEGPRPKRTLFVNGSFATMAEGGEGLGLLERGALLVDGEKIAWVGRDSSPQPAAGQEADYRRVDLQGRVLTPALIDCHTHLIFAGNRASEFEMRLKGISYAEIARQGGGIRSTVEATRRAGPEELLKSALARVERLASEGVATIEVKSGYGLDTENELKMLRVARKLNEQQPIDIIPTFLGAHALPPESAEDRSGYLHRIVNEMLPRVAAEGLAAGVDGFCETIAFSRDEMEFVFRKSLQLGLPIKLHAEQLSNQGGAAMAAGLGALSADHLEYLGADGVKAMSESGTVAVLLPGAFYYLGETHKPPIDALRRAGVPLAVATDLNPGSSPIFSLLTAMNMACVLFGLTPAEALAGTTSFAARALGLSDRGQLVEGRLADLAIWEVEHPSELAYSLGWNPCCGLIKRGQWVFKSEELEPGANPGRER